jgi:predicted ribosome quality control (RQC) complex YloA/Tae2 family protein
MAAWARLRLDHERAVALRTQIARGLRAEREKVRRAAGRLARDRSKIGDAAAQRRFGEALLANLGEVPRGASAVVLRNPYGEPPEIEVELDPRRSPAANAEAYFRSARRAERAAEHLAARERALAERDRELARGLERLDEAGDDALPALLRDLGRAGLLAADLTSAAPADGKKAEGPRAPRDGERATRLPYRSYELGGGWEAWVGRSNADNDVLTHRLARPHDLWFHVHGASGSHVILRRSDGARGEPPASVVQAAAACAAFFSRARHSRLVPVIVTEKRYVRKPRSSPPGTAACLRERTMMVEPVRPAVAELYGREESMRAEARAEATGQRERRGSGKAKDGRAKETSSEEQQGGGRQSERRGSEGRKGEGR